MVKLSSGGAKILRGVSMLYRGVCCAFLDNDRVRFPYSVNISIVRDWRGASPKSNATLFVGQDASGEAASCAHCSGKLLFEQQLKHCVKLLQEKINWIQDCCRLSRKY